MQPTSIGTLAKIMKGSIQRGNPHTIVDSLNMGRYNHLYRKQVYFYSKKSNAEKQIAAINAVRPVAVVLPVEVPTSRIRSDIAIIRSNGCYTSFWKVAMWNWKKHQSNLITIGITGSAGKTTTTSMVHSILKNKLSMVKTLGNYNITSFLCNYLTELKSHHRLLLLEMGMNSRGDIARQCIITQPNIGAITNVGEAHIGSLGSSNEVVKAKQELLSGMRKGGTIYLNKDDAKSQHLDITKCKGKVKYFSLNKTANIMGSDVKYTDQGMSFNITLLGDPKKYPVFLPTFGKHNVYNALAATGIALSAGASMKEIQKGLANFQTPRMRLQLIKSRLGHLLINDAWNANPTAMKAGLDVLKTISKTRPTVAVLGNMLELGQFSTSAHEEVGKYVATLGIDTLVTVGTQGKIIAAAARKHGMKNIYSYSTLDGTLSKLRALSKKSTLYFKASRKVHLEKLVSALK